MWMHGDWGWGSQHVAATPRSVVQSYAPWVSAACYMGTTQLAEPATGLVLSCMMEWHCANGLLCGGCVLVCACARVRACVRACVRARLDGSVI